MKERRDFQRIERRGRRAAGPHFVLLADAPREGQRRLGVTVSRRVGGAVTRNRIKRYLREVFRCRRESFPPGDAVVIARGGAGALGYHQVAAELDRLFARLGR